MFSFFNNKLKYLIIGAGATGCTFACLLKSKNKNVTLISKYDYIIDGVKRNHGMTLDCKITGKNKYDVTVKKEENYKEKADVIILCVRTPNIPELIPFIKNSSHKNTIVFSIANGFGIGQALKNKLGKDLNVMNASFVGQCRCYNPKGAEVLQLKEFLNLQLSFLDNYVDNTITEKLISDLNSASIQTTLISERRFNQISFERLITRSPYEACCMYYNITANEIKDEKEITFKKLCNELITLSKAMDIQIDKDFLDNYYKNFENYKKADSANVESQILKDITKEKKQPEIDFFIFIVLELAKKYNVSLPTYSMVADKFKEYNTLEKFNI